MKEYKHYINKKKILSEEELNEISFLTEQLNTLKRVYDLCGKLEDELEKKNIYELMIEAENQYNEYLREIWYLKFCERTGCPF